MIGNQSADDPGQTLEDPLVVVLVWSCHSFAQAGHLFPGWFLQNALMTPMVCPRPASYSWSLVFREY
ncbi:hypothetical protein ACZ91_53070 [Streptomyces regensis]|nr:hypothetical protein ACZ91_53070 [Streptomyces regensis]